MPVEETPVDQERIATAADFARALRTLRERAGLTIREVAKAAGTSVSTTGDYFSGRHLPLDRQQFARILVACGEDDPARIDWWQAALARVRRAPGRRGESPYRGLARFEQGDARWFFGREGVTELVSFLAEQQSDLPLMLVGASGAGKSSLLRAGVLPRLEEAGLAVTVVDPTTTGVPGLGRVVGELAARPAWGGQPGSPALIVDQFEAVFTLGHDEAERRALIAALCELARTHLVVLALRADYYSQAIRYPGLLRALQERHVVLGPMTAEQVRRAVTEPPKLARAGVEDGLAELVLADLAPLHAGQPHAGQPAPDSLSGTGEPTWEPADQAHEPGALPLLSHALLAAWEHSTGGVITVADYLASGGIRDAVTQSAERAYGGLTAEQQDLARRLLLRLVHVADDLPPSRASVPLAELRGPGIGNDDADTVLAVFVEQRMISVDADSAQLTHDALLTAWPRLRSWIEEDAEALRARRRITLGARAWTEAGREEAALWRGSQLAIAREWAADAARRSALPAQAREFVDASVAAGTASERLARRRTRRLRAIVVVLAALVVAVAGLTGYTSSLRTDAVNAEHAAVADGLAADSREVAFVADSDRGTDPALAGQLSLGAYAIARTPQATASLLDASGAPAAARIEDSPSVVQAVSVSPDHRLLVAAGADGSLKLWSVVFPGRPVLVATLLAADKADPLYTAAFSPDGSLIAAAGAAHVVRLWRVSGSDSGGAVPQVTPAGPALTGAGNTIYSVAFRPDGKVLAAGSADGTVRLWNVTNPAHARLTGRPLSVAPKGKGAPPFVQAVAFSPDGRSLAAGTSAGQVWLWDVSRAATPVPFRTEPLTGPLGGAAAFVAGLAFSPDGRTLAAASQDDKVWLWTVHPGTGTSAKKRGKAVPAGSLAGATNWVNTLAFSPDGASLAAGTSDASVLVYSLRTHAITATLAQPQPVTSVAWDGPTRIVNADANGTIALWKLPSPVLNVTSQTGAVAYSPDGKTLAVGGTSVQLWDTATHELLAAHALPSGAVVNAIAFSPGQAARPVIAVALSNGTVILLGGQTLRPLGPPVPVISGSGAAESVAFSPDGAVIVTGADDGTVRLIDVADPSHPRQLTSVPDSGSAVYTVAFAPDGTLVAAASIDDEVRLWQVTAAAGAGSPGTLTSAGPALGAMASYAIGLAFSPDSKTLAVGSADQTVHLWDVADAARPRALGAPLTGPAGYVWAAAFSPDGKTLAVGVTDGTVWLWNVANPARPVLIATLSGPADHVYSVAFAPSGDQLAASSYDGAVYVWDTSPAAARAAVCANLGQPISAAEWSSAAPGVPYQAPCA
jgi:WD40 repeat protein/transcriptional regulator with XRE-family HTH domain